MRIFKNTRFARFADKEGITDDELRQAAGLLDAGRFAADLGGGVYKIRVARTGGGKSGGYRVIVIFRSGERTFYVEGFAKSTRDNISRKEKKKFKELAGDYLWLSETIVDGMLRTRMLVEI